MAEGGTLNEDVPVYEHVDVNTKPFHIGTFRNLWMSVLTPEAYSYRRRSAEEEEEDEEFRAELGIAPETLQELKAICSTDSLRSHPEEEPPDPDVVPDNPQLDTLKCV